MNNVITITHRITHYTKFTSRLIKTTIRFLFFILLFITFYHFFFTINVTVLSFIFQGLMSKELLIEESHMRRVCVAENVHIQQLSASLCQPFICWQTSFTVTTNISERSFNHRRRKKRINKRINKINNHICYDKKL